MCVCNVLTMRSMKCDLVMKFDLVMNEHPLVGIQSMFVYFIRMEC